jgi:hypothetical protein
VESLVSYRSYVVVSTVLVVVAVAVSYPLSRLFSKDDYERNIYKYALTFGNFGFLIDNKTNKIVSPAPLFDHGNSLFNFAGCDDFSSEVALKRYAETLLPCVYDDFVASAKKVLTPAHKEGVRSLLNFNFKKHSRYNLPSARLKLIEKQIKCRAKELLD